MLVLKMIPKAYIVSEKTQTILLQKNLLLVKLKNFLTDNILEFRQHHKSDRKNDHVSNVETVHRRRRTEPRKIGTADGLYGKNRLGLLSSDE